MASEMKDTKESLEQTAAILAIPERYRNVCRRAITTKELILSGVLPKLTIEELNHSIIPFVMANGIVELDLSRQNLGNEGARLIAEALKVNSVLSTLNLKSNLLDIEGIRAIAQALKGNYVLNTLDLTLNALDLTSVHLFEQILLEENHTITNLFMSGYIESPTIQEYLLRNIEEHASALIKVPTVENINEFLKLTGDELANLITLKLRGEEINRLDDERFQAFCIALSKCTHLRRLDLEFLYKLDIGRLQALLTALLPCTRLQILYLSNSGLEIGVNARKELCTLISTCTELRILNLIGNHFNRLNAADFQELFTTLSTLQALNLYSVKSIFHNEAFYDTLPLCTELQCLALRLTNFHNIDDNHFQRFCHAISQTKGLIQICGMLECSLERQQCLQDILYTHITALPQHQNLQTIHLWSLNELNDKCFEALCASLPNCQNLKTLNCFGIYLNELSPECFEALCKAVKQCPALLQIENTESDILKTKPSHLKRQKILQDIIDVNIKQRRMRSMEVTRLAVKRPPPHPEQVQMGEEALPYDVIPRILHMAGLAKKPTWEPIDKKHKKNTTKEETKRQKDTEVKTSEEELKIHVDFPHNINIEVIDEDSARQVAVHQNITEDIQNEDKHTMEALTRNQLLEMIEVEFSSSTSPLQEDSLCDILISHGIRNPSPNEVTSSNELTVNRVKHSILIMLRNRLNKIPENAMGNELFNTFRQNINDLVFWADLNPLFQQNHSITPTQTEQLVERSLRECIKRHVQTIIERWAIRPSNVNDRTKPTGR